MLFKSKIFPSSHAIKDESIVIVVMTMQISTHIKIIAFVPAPTHKIMTGPSAIFGKEFKTTMYGSKIFLTFSFHHKRTAIKYPSTVAITKPIKVS